MLPFTGPVRFTPAQLFALAGEIAHAFGAKDAHGAPLRFVAPPDERRVVALRQVLRLALDAVRPVARAPAIGDVLAALADHVTRARDGGGRHVRRQLAELDELVALAAYGRAKRAERSRLLAVLLVFFELDVALGFATDDDLETTLRLTRRGVEETLRRAR